MSVPVLICTKKRPSRAGQSDGDTELFAILFWGEVKPIPLPYTPLSASGGGLGLRFARGGQVPANPAFWVTSSSRTLKNKPLQPLPIFGRVRLSTKGGGIGQIDIRTRHRGVARLGSTGKAQTQVRQDLLARTMSATSDQSGLERSAGFRLVSEKHG